MITGLKMTTEEIRKGAPDEAASHYHELSEFIVYLKGETGYWYWWNPFFEEWLPDSTADTYNIKPL